MDAAKNTLNLFLRNLFLVILEIGRARPTPTNVKKKTKTSNNLLEFSVAE